MKFSVLALDYDGTIARHDTVDPDVRAAIAEARARGIVVVLVTGRILADLRRVAGDLHFVDAVVAENGAVLEFPDTGYSVVAGAAPPPALLDALAAGGIKCSAGEVVVEADAREGERILALVRRLELPLALLFNRGRVMVLPQAISKATGLRQALTILRLSPHNALAIGDAENDHELLAACEVGVAVAWGSAALKASADYVLEGNGPHAVAGYLREMANRRIPAPVNTRRRLRLGHGTDGRPLALAVRGRNVLIAGDTKSGKSWVTGLLCEQLILYGYCICVLDPEGDYVSLEALPGVVVYGGADPLPRPMDLLRALRHPDGSVVIDLSQATHDEKRDYLRSVLPALAALRRHTGLPHRIVVDEAHYFLHDADVLRLLDLELSGYTLVTYRASQLHRDILAASQAILVTRETDPDEIRALVALCRTGETDTAHWQALLGSLAVGEAVALPVTEEAEGQARRIRLAPRLTPHVRHLAKYVDVPVPSGRAFAFWWNGAEAGRRARTLREFVEIVEAARADDLRGHLRRGDFSRWVTEVFGDYPLAKDIRHIEDEYRRGLTTDVGPSLCRAVRSRYDFVAPLPHRHPGEQESSHGHPGTH